MTKHAHANIWVDLAPFKPLGGAVRLSYAQGGTSPDYAWLEEDDGEGNFSKGHALPLAVSDIPIIQAFLNKVWMSQPGNNDLSHYLMSLPKKTDFIDEVVKERTKNPKFPKLVKAAGKRRKK